MTKDYLSVQVVCDDKLQTMIDEKMPFLKGLPNDTKVIFILQLRQFWLGILQNKYFTEDLMKISQLINDLAPMKE